MTIAIDQGRLAQITMLDEGAHENFSEGVCAMEAASYIAGEPWSDHPQCVCPVIAAFLRSWNDSLPDDKRTDLLLPLITTTIDTRGSDSLANRRATMVTDWLVRVHTPAWLRLAGLTDRAGTLADLPEIIDFENALLTAGAALEKAMKGVGAAEAAAWDAAWDAGRAAAEDAAGAAGVAALEEIMKGADAAVWDAVWAAPAMATMATMAPAAADDAWEYLTPVVAELQASAVDLVNRMCSLTDDDIGATPDPNTERTDT